MAGRLAAVAALVALATAGAASPTSSSTWIFRARPDPRMCPSPACGGYWVSRVNRATTTCVGGAERAWCYVAALERPSATTPVTLLLLRGEIVPDSPTGLGTFGRLRTKAAWSAATRATWGGTVYLVSDTGIRCIRTPCFALRAAIVNTTRRLTASGMDLSAVGASAALVRKARLAVSTGGLLVAGTIRREADGGRTVVAGQFFLGAPRDARLRGG